MGAWKCSKCGREWESDDDDSCYRISREPVCTDCYFEAFGELMERPRRPGPPKARKPRKKKKARTNKMTSWSVIRDSLTVSSRPNTIGRQIALVAASDLFIKLLPNLVDGEASTAEWKAEPELVNALANRETHKMLRDVGVLRGGV